MNCKNCKHFNPIIGTYYGRCNKGIANTFTEITLPQRRATIGRFVDDNFGCKKFKEESTQGIIGLAYKEGLKLLNRVLHENYDINEQHHISPRLRDDIQKHLDHNK